MSDARPLGWGCCSSPQTAPPPGWSVCCSGKTSSPSRPEESHPDGGSEPPENREAKAETLAPLAIKELSMVLKSLAGLPQPTPPHPTLVASRS